MNRKVYSVDKAGSLKKLQNKEEPLSDRKENEVTVRVHSIGLNFADIFAIKGLYSATPEGAFVPGLEFAGEVVDPGRSEYKIGDRVMGVTRFGGYTSMIHQLPEYLRKIPEDWSYEDGAAFPVQALTAYYALIPLGAIKEGDTVLINSAAGGVGVWANRIAKRFNAYTIGTVGSDAKFEVLKDEGYDDYFSRSNNFKNDLYKALGNRKLQLALDSVGGQVMMDSYHALASTGRLVSYGSARFTQQNRTPNFAKLAYTYLTRPKFDPMKMVTDNKSVMAFNLIWLYEEMDLLKEVFDGLLALKLSKPLIGHRYNFDQIHEALIKFQSGTTVGKVVVNLED